MRLRAMLLAGAIALGSFTMAPALAQDTDAGISFDSFHDDLAPYGAWLYSDRWGMVWQPSDVPDDFQPYYGDGHWVDTDDYGWMWVSDYPWGDIAFHYGRWVDDPDDGWLWIPGYTWSPAWVVWRSNGDYVGWMPMPPDNDFLEGGGDVGAGFTISFDSGDPWFGYRRWYGNDYDEDRFAHNWVFINMGHMDDRDYRRDAVHDPRQVINIIHDSHNVTNYRVVNNHVVNRSVDAQAVARASGHPIRPVAARTVIRHPNMVATVQAGRQARERWHGAIPVGHGVAGSAPPPPPNVVSRLSTNVHPHNGKPPAHLFTRTAVTRPEAMSHFHGAAAPGNGGNHAPPPNHVAPNGAPNHETPQQMIQHQPNGTEHMPPEQQPPAMMRRETPPNAAPEHKPMEQQAPVREHRMPPAMMRRETPPNTAPEHAPMEQQAPVREHRTPPEMMRRESPNTTAPSGPAAPMEQRRERGMPPGSGPNGTMEHRPPETEHRGPNAAPSHPEHAPPPERGKHEPPPKDRHDDQPH